MKNKNSGVEQLNSTILEIKRLLQQVIAIQAYKSGATQDDIAKNMKIAKVTINKMVKGIKRVEKNDEQ